MESERLQLHESLLNEISKGMEQVKQRVFSAKNENENDRVLERMLASYAEALLILTGRAPQGQCESVISSSSDSPGSSLKRKSREDIQTVKIETIGGVLDDGYSWRKDGAKEIKGFKFPRRYYRCAQERGCWARKHVHRSCIDPTKFEVKYIREHTCQAGASAKTGSIGNPRKMR